MKRTKATSLILCIMMLGVFISPVGTALAAGDEVAPRAGIPVHGWISGDGHSHTTHSSDGKNTTAEMIQAARAAGLNFLVITDHHNSDAYANGELAEHESNTMITTIWGQEYTKHAEGHATIMSMKPIRDYRPTGDHSVIMPMRDMINEVHASNGIVIAAHPYDVDVPMRASGWQNYPWDAVEVWNGFYGGRHDSSVKAMAYWDRQNRKNLDSTDANAAKQRIYGVAQSDLHETTYFGKTVYTKTYVNSLTAQDIFNAYKKGNLYGTNGPTLSFSINGQIMGSDVVLDPDDFDNIDTDTPWTGRSLLTPRADTTTKVNVKIGGQYDKGLKRAVLIHNKHRDGDSGFTGPDGQKSYSYSTVFNLNGVTSFEREFTVEVAEGDFLRLELEGNDGNTLNAMSQDTTGFAFSNPIFISANSRTSAELNDLITEAAKIRTDNTRDFAYTSVALNNLNSAINSASAIRQQMGGSAANKPSVSQVNYAYNLLRKAMDDFAFFPKVPKNPNSWYKDPGTQNVYYVNGSGNLMTSIQMLNGKKYYFSEQTGAALLHWQKLNGQWHYFEPNGELGAKGSAFEGFQEINGGRYYFRPTPDNTMAVSHSNIDGQWYYFNESGRMYTGWLKDGESWYLFDRVTGISVTGWYSENGQDYYLNPGDRKTLSGMHIIDGRRYFFNPTGQKIKGGWQQSGNDKYYVLSGECATGWNNIGGRWYLFNGDGVMLTGWRKDGNTWYYLDEAGVMKVGWFQDGKTATGADRWYYLNGGGAMKVGWHVVNGRWYYFKGSGEMMLGWHKEGGIWYYLKDSGAMAQGWEKVSGQWYYFNGSGAMQTGTHVIDGRSYTFDASGAWNGK